MGKLKIAVGQGLKVPSPDISYTNTLTTSAVSFDKFSVDTHLSLQAA